MLICIGGFPGSRRKRLTHELSKALGFYIYPLRRTKHSLSLEGLHKLTRPARNVPYSDEMLVQVYRKVGEDFPLLSKMYPDIIVKDHFHREVPRELFFKVAEQYFGPPLIVWAESSEEQSAARLGGRLTGKQKKLASKLALEEAMRRDYQPFKREIHTVDYVSDPEAALKHVLDLLRRK